MQATQSLPPLRVAQVIGSLNVGGAERVALNLANTLARHGHQSVLICTRGRGLLAEFVSPDVELIVLERTRRWDFGAMRRMAELLDERRIDIAHSHGFTASYFTRLARRYCTHSWKHVCHDHHGPDRGMWKYGLLNRLFLSRVDAFIAVSEKIQNRLLRTLPLNKEQCPVIGNGVEIPEEAAELADTAAPRIIQVANLRIEKDHITALHAAALLRKKHPNLVWQCLGARKDPEHIDYENRLIREIEEYRAGNYFQLLGSQTDVRSYLLKASVGILCSTAEGLPIALLEYMAHGLPVVVTGVGQMPQVMEKGNCGYAVEPSDPKTLAEKIDLLLSDRHLARQFGRNGRQCIERYYSVEAMTQAVERVYQQVLAK